MGYQILTLDELRQIAGTIAVRYKGSNQDRLSFVTLANRLVNDEALMASPDAVNILMGAYIYEMEHIENTYRLRSPENSTMFDTLKKALKISASNPISNENKLIYLSAFYKYIQTSAPKDIAANTKWMAKEALQRPVLAAIKTLLGKLYHQIHCILTSQPSYAQLHRHLQNVEERYMAAPSTGWFASDKSHRPQAKFMDFMNRYCDTFLPHVESNTLDPALQVLESYLLRQAAAVFVMKSIEEAKYQPTNSALYNMCVKATNFKHTNDIDPEDQINWLGMLGSHIKSMLDNRKEFISAEEKADYKNIRTELKRIQGKIFEYQSNVFKQKEAPSRIQSNMIFATGGVASHGIQAFIKNVVGDVIPSPGAVVMDATAGAIGSPFGPGGMFAMYALSRFIRSVVFPLAIAGVCASAVDTAGTKIGEVTTAVVSAPFSLTANVVTGAISWYRHVEFDKNELRKNEPLLEALASLPDDAFDAGNKAVIENTFGVKPKLAM